MRMLLAAIPFSLLTFSIVALGAVHSAIDEVTIVSSKHGGFVSDLRGRSLADAQAVAGVDSLDASPARRNLRQHSDVLVGTGDFALRATVVIDEMSSRGSGISFDGGAVILDDREWGAVLAGRLFGGGRFPFETQRPASARPGAPIQVEISRYEGSLAVKLNDFEMGRIGMSGFSLGRIGFDLAEGNMRVLECTLEGDFSRFPLPMAAFSSADGDIDEYRDPSVASDGRRALVAAIAVRTSEDGKTRDALSVRFVEVDGRMSAPHSIDLGTGSVEIAVLGYAHGEPRPWKLLVQESNGKRVTEQLTAYDSADGLAFTRSSTVEAANRPVRLMTGSMTELDGGLVASATTARGGVARAAAVRFNAKEGWTLSELTEDPSCEPFWLRDGRVVLRKPGTLEREILAGGVKSTASGFEAGPSGAGLLFARNSSLGVAVAEPSFPYPLHELISLDQGGSWTRARTIWGGSASNSSSTAFSGGRILVFEGGDRARREHILVLRLRDELCHPPDANTPKRDGTSVAPKSNS